MLINYTLKDGSVIQAPSNKHFLLKHTQAGISIYYPPTFVEDIGIQLRQQTIPFSEDQWTWLKENHAPDEKQIETLIHSKKSNDRWFAAARLDYQPTMEQVLSGLLDIEPCIRARWMMRDDWSLTQEIFEAYICDITKLSLLSRKDIQNVTITPEQISELKTKANEEQNEALSRIISHIESGKLKSEHFDTNDNKSNRKRKAL